jgi:hypothetical protein
MHTFICATLGGWTAKRGDETSVDGVPSGARCRKGCRKDTAKHSNAIDCPFMSISLIIVEKALFMA